MTADSSRRFVEASLLRAEKALRSAKLLLKHGELEDAVSRAYYAMFYAAEALLLSMDLAYSRHSAVHAAFGQYFGKTGKTPPEYHRFLKDAQDLRLAGDYGGRHSVTPEQAEEQIAHAGQFLQFASELLGG